MSKMKRNYKLFTDELTARIKFIFQSKKRAEVVDEKLLNEIKIMFLFADLKSAFENNREGEINNILNEIKQIKDNWLDINEVSDFFYNLDLYLDGGSLDFEYLKGSFVKEILSPAGYFKKQLLGKINTSLISLFSEKKWNSEFEKTKLYKDLVFK